MSLWILAVTVFVLNVPFGYWRANVTKMSPQWFVAIHAPVLLVFLLRLLAGIGWQLDTFPVLVAAFFAGQYLGARLHRWGRTQSTNPVTSCLVLDIVRRLQAG